MKRKHLIIIIAQSVVIILLVVYAFVQQSIAKAAQREAETQKEMALANRAEAEMQKLLAEKYAERAMRAEKEAIEANQRLSKK